MNWATIKRWLTKDRDVHEKGRDVHELSGETADAGVIACATNVRGCADGKSVAPDAMDEALAQPAAGTRSSERTRLWRRRALLRKGARLYSTMTRSRDFVSLAMLDEDGIVVAWYERAEDRDFDQAPLVRQHVSRLYLPGDVALGFPIRDLCNATIQGSSRQTGWRRGTDGAAFWASTVIEAVLLRDGRLQGFSHTTHRRAAPWKGPPTPTVWSADGTDGTAPSTSMQTQGKIGSCARTAAAIVAMVVASVPLAAAAIERARAAPPPNAVQSEYGSGWECMHGHRRVADACVAISMPKNAYLDASGNRWRCERGYLNVNESCVAIDLPANAFLDDSYGTGWRCERGHREAKGACVAVQIPANAYETDSSFGVGWECNRGYVLTAGKCEALDVPVHAYMTRLGDDWKCDRGFVKTSGACVEVRVPANAYLDVHGNGWSCNRGFRRVNSQCEALQLPPNSHVDYTGDGWKCNRGFRDQGGACVKN